jgi:hypothetical protein
LICLFRFILLFLYWKCSIQSKNLFYGNTTANRVSISFSVFDRRLYLSHAEILVRKKERLATQTARLIVKAQDFSLEKAEMQKRVRELSGNPTPRF